MSWILISYIWLLSISECIICQSWNIFFSQNIWYISHSMLHSYAICQTLLYSKEEFGWANDDLFFKHERNNHEDNV